MYALTQIVHPGAEAFGFIQEVRNTSFLWMTQEGKTDLKFYIILDSLDLVLDFQFTKLPRSRLRQPYRTCNIFYFQFKHLAYIFFSVRR